MVIQTYAYPAIFQKEAWVAAVIKVLRQAEDGDFVFVRFTVPRAELGAVAAFVAVGVEVQRLETVLEAWDRHGYVGAVRADIHTLAANVVTFKAASGFLRDKRVTSALIGASRPEQIVELVGALKQPDFSAAELAAIDQHAVDGGLNLWKRPSTDQRLA